MVEEVELHYTTLVGMGFISRKIFPACCRMCVCCPALRSSSRQPVKRYRKLLADIFPKSPDELPSERKIAKLCEYAAKNPFRIPKIAKYLEERCYKELRSEHIKLVNIVAEAFNKLISHCKVQIAYFAVDVLNVVSELLGYSKHDAIQILGCQTLTSFIYSQVDATYARSIEKLVRKVCMLSREHGKTHENRCLRASSLQCLSAMVWFMAEFSHIFVDFDEIIRTTLDNYMQDRQSEDADLREGPHHNWVDEVVQCEGRGGLVVGNDTRSRCLIIWQQLEIKDPSLLTGEEMGKPEIWAQICIQRLVELAKESTTMRRVLDPMFVYFDSGRHWSPPKGLAIMVLSSMAYFMENSGNQQLILASVIRHLDHKNVLHDPHLKASIIQVATSLAVQIRTGRGLVEFGFVDDLCRHLRKSLQASGEFVGEQELNSNILLQISIEECLLEFSKRVSDVRPLLDLMAITLENLPSGVLARASIGSLIILARVVTVVLPSLHSQQAFPEVLLMQLIKAMLHSDLETSVGAHQIFALILFPNSFHSHLVPSRSRSLHNKRPSHSTSASASISALMEKLRGGRDSANLENHGDIVDDGCRERGIVEEDRNQQGRGSNISPNFYKLKSVIDSTSLTESEPYIMELSEDQMAQLLSAFWIQANLPDNLPSKFEAIAHSFMLTLTVLRIKNLKDNLLVRFFQLPLSLWSMLLDPGMLPPACQRSIFVFSAGMLMFACKLYHIHDLHDMFTSLAISEVDPFMGISDYLQVCAKMDVDVKGYGTADDNQMATSVLSVLRNKIPEYLQTTKNVLVQNLTSITELDADHLDTLLSEAFRPDEEFMFGPQWVLDNNQMILHSKESMSLDGDVLSSSAVEDDSISEASVSEFSRSIPKMPASPSLLRVISVGRLMESVLEVAGQVAGTVVSASPLPYSAMANQCEAIGTGTRKKLSSWLAYDYSQVADKSLLKVSDNSNRDSLVMKLPPASPFDNFLIAAGR
ncbi:protein SEMI-ROLLED LEAF 2-like isoform X1 [Arachis stenosperma]|uniref:protein SEMI-ROLLED LEAF 2-like isoform X1 n=3 Tax=Arachis stenosperma TaxID=217475 RepID=UPI0025AC21BE|nr:protein SEMI-ROLLED LEAF 2-like isoform X1 [Arachis stenosperma]